MAKQEYGLSSSTEGDKNSLVYRFEGSTDEQSISMNIFVQSIINENITIQDHFFENASMQGTMLYQKAWI